jgi:hypothetical protein
MLRGKKPEAVSKRLKLFMFGPAGVGKTTACTLFPKSYIIDCERGTENYDKLVNASGSVVFQTTDINEAITEVKSLLTEKHDFRTLVIDPITTIYNDLLEKSELKVGSEFGRHYGEANKHMKRLANLIMALDLNVIITAHAKTEYGQNLSKIGFTFDGWKQLDYWFDLVLELGRKGGAKRGPRIAKVVKTRLEQFPDEDVFDWTYENFAARYGEEALEREANTVVLATPDQIRGIKDLLAIVRLPDGTTDKWFSKANVEIGVWEDMPAEVLDKCIEYVKGKLPSAASAA